MTNDKRNVIWNIIGATANAFNSLLFAIIVTRINGVDDAGIFMYSFATACLLYMIAVYEGRVFQVTDISKKNTDTDYIYHRIITCALMIFISILFVISKGYNWYKSSVFVLLCIFKCVEAFSESIYAVIQKNDLLYKVGISMFIKAIIAFLVFGIIDYFTKNLILACAGIILINIIVLIVYDFKNMRKLVMTKSKISKEAIIRLFKTGFFTFVLTFLANYLINAPRYAIDDILTNDLQTIFGIIIMPATLMGLLGQYIIQPCLIKITNSIESKDYIRLKRIILCLVGIILILGVVVTIVAYFLETPVLELIYGVELKPYFTSMLIIVVGSILYGLSTILSSILIAMRKTGGQALLYLATAIIATIMSYITVKANQIQGASITYFITMLTIVLLFSGYTFYSMLCYKKQWNINS